MTSFPELGEAAQRFVARRGKLLINGAWVDALSGKTFDAIDPASEAVIKTLAEAGPEDVDLAVKAARQAFEDSAWSRMRPVERERLINKLADLIERNTDELGELESIDNGKLQFLAKVVDVHGAVDSFRYMAGWATKIEGRTLDVSCGFPGEEYQAFTLRQPVGVVGQIIPWNFPIAMAAWKLGPALATGCTVVLKPAEETSLTALRLGELIIEAGFPPGVVNIITGFGEVAGAAIVAHPDVDKIAFTGSTVVGKLIGRQVVDTMKRVTLELGGKSPVIVFADADIDQAIAGAANAIFFNQGQVCTAGSRLYVHASIFDKVVAGVAAIAKSLKIGAGSAPDSQLGPLVSQVQMERVLGYIAKGVAEGGQVVTGGKRHGNTGFFVEPTVFTNVGADATIVREEIFGPVLVATPFSSEDEIVAVANNTDYGLGASVWTSNLGTAHRMARRIKAGTVWVNNHMSVDPNLPFGGMKQSGYGRENGRDIIEHYTEIKSVLIKIQ